MNPNGNHDRELLEQVEHLLHEGHPAGDSLLDDLAHTVPQARTEFQNQLEDRLMTHMQSRPLSIEGEESMTSISTRPPRHLATPLTLAAALLAMVLVGSILLIGGSRPSTPGFIAAGAATDTPTLTPTITTLGVVSSLQAVNVREQPSTSANAIRALNPGTHVDVIGQSADGLWLNIRMDDGQYGWIAASLVNINPTGTFEPLDSQVLQNAAQSALETQVGGVDCSPQAVEFLQEQLRDVQSQLTQLQTDYDASVAKGSTLTSAVDIAANQAELTSISGSLTNTQALYDQLNQSVLRCPSPATPPSAMGVVSSLQAVNVREQPSTSATAMRALDPGTQVEILGQSADGLWLNIRMGDGQEGWISFSLINIMTGYATAAETPEWQVGLQATPDITLIRLVVARQNIPAGFRFPDNTDELANYVTYAPWPLEAVPVAALVENGSGIDSLAGKILRTDVFREQPIMQSLLVDGPPAAISGVMTLLADRVAVSIPTSLLAPVSYEVRAGDTVDVIASLLFVDNQLFLGADPILISPNTTVQAVTPAVTGTPPTPQLITQRLVENAQVIYVGEVKPGDSTPVPTPQGGEINVVELAVTQQEATILKWLIDAQIPLTLVHSASVPSTCIPVVIARQFLPLGAKITADMLTITYWPLSLIPSGMTSDPTTLVGQYANEPVEAWQPVLSSAVTQEKIFDNQFIPPGMFGTDIPMSWITGIPDDLKAGDTIDITVSFMTTGWREDSRETINTTIPADGFIARKTILRGIHVSKVGMLDGTLPNPYNALSVYWTAENAFLLNWIDHAGLPFALTITRTNAAPVDLHLEFTPDGQVVVSIPLANVPEALTYPAQVQILGQMAYVTYSGDFSTPDQFPSQPVTEIVVRDAQIIGHAASSSADTANRFTIVISAEDLAKLRWFIEAGIPLTVAS